MRERITHAVAPAENLDQLEERLTAFLASITQEEGLERIGYVAGCVSSDGEEHIQHNLEKLAEHTRGLEREHGFPLFCVTDIFTPELYRRLEEMEWPVEAREQRMRSCFCNILQSGHITDLIMTPGWEGSTGSWEEHSTAETNGLRIHYV